MQEPQLSRALRNLTDADPKRRARAERDLQYESSNLAVIHALHEALETGHAGLRRAAARVMGHLSLGAEEGEALIVALSDEDAKLRKNAATALGRQGNPRCFEALCARLGEEEIHWVRVALVLALGAIDLPEVLPWLEAHDALSEEEADALRKAVEKKQSQDPDFVQEPVSWKRDTDWRPALRVSMVRGLEDIAREEIEEAGLEIKNEKEGSMMLADGTAPWAWENLRCVHEGRLVLAKRKRNDPMLLGQMMQELPWKALHKALDRPEGPLKLRFGVEDVRQNAESISRATHRKLLAQFKEVLAARGMQDSTSRYHLALWWRIEDRQVSVEIAMPWVGAERFAYRVRDVGASIDPVIAACLARMVRTPKTEQVLDPTCGSATLLIERVKLAEVPKVLGRDVSPTAVSAAVENLLAADLDDVRIVRRAAREPWPECDEILCNLPFGVRTKRLDQSLDELYDDVIQNISASLRPKGRALLYTSATGRLWDALRQGRDLKIISRRKIMAGGLEVGIVLLGRKRAY